jgi:phosphatidylglycerophosphate synthase
MLRDSTKISRMTHLPCHADPHSTGIRPTAIRDFARVVAAQLVLLGLLFAVAPGPLKPAGAGALLLYLAATSMVAALMRTHYPHARLGLCNAVTHSRLALLVPLAAALAVPEAVGTPAIGWALFGFASVVLALDGLDGWLARRERLCSGFGARFDVEVDAALALVLAALAWRSGAAGPWVLALGLPRYLFLMAQMPLPWLRAPLPERRWRKVVCALQIGALIMLLCPAVPATVAAPVAGAAALAVAHSFAVDIRWLARRGPLK